MLPFNPYPTHAEEALEARVEALLTEQHRAAERFRAALAVFRRAVVALDFPLGSPVEGYGLDDLTDLLDQFAIPAAPDTDRAWDRARDECVA